MRSLVFPLLLAANAAGTAYALARGLPPPLVMAIVTVGMAAAVLALERWLPYAGEWRRSHGDVTTDFLHLTVTGAMVAVPALAIGAAVLAAEPARRLGIDVWPTSWPLLAQLPFAVLLAELGGYLFHRAEHRGGALWRLHAVHHSAPRLYWLNAARFHPLEGLLASLATTLPFVLIGAGAPMIAMFSIFAGGYRMMQHSNIDVRLGPLNRVFSMAEVHRWHHSRRVEESNANYGSIFLIWDLVFGTYRFPADRAPPLDTGLADAPDFPQSWAGQIAAPFRRALWRRRA